MRGPQSRQSVPHAQAAYSAPEPPSSQSVSEVWMHVLVQPTVTGSAGGAGGDATPGARGPQSLQSLPREHTLNSAPGPPSSQSLSEAW